MMFLVAGVRGFCFGVKLPFYPKLMDSSSMCLEKSRVVFLELYLITG